MDDIRPHTPGCSSCTPSRYGKNGLAVQASSLVPEVTVEGKFAFSPAQLSQLVQRGNPSDLDAFGGLPGLVRGIRTNEKSGLSVDEDIISSIVTTDNAVSPGWSAGKIALEESDKQESTPGKFSDRKEFYGTNSIPRREPKTFLQLLWLAFNDKLMFLLTASATISLALGIYQSITAEEGVPRIEWVEGVAIIVAIVVIVSITAINDYQKNYKFQKLNQRKEERYVIVTRSGHCRSISIYEVLVGDLLHLEAGDVVPADGILTDGFDIQCDESPLTGESALVDKTPCHRNADIGPDASLFVLSGTRVATGVGSYLVLQVGANSAHGRILTAVDDEIEETPLQQKLGVLAKQIIVVGFASGVIFFTILLIRFLVELKDMDGGARVKGEAFLDILILSITVIVIMVPEGLPLTVTLALAFATTRMLKDNMLVRLLRSCETMGNATTICSDKTGTLTQNKMTVVAGTVGAGARFVDGQAPALLQANSENGALGIEAFIKSLTNDKRQLIKNSIVLNSTAVERGGKGEFSGSGTETALLKFASHHLSLDEINQERENGNIVEMVPFDAEKKWMATLVKLPSGGYRMFVKGAAEIIFQRCDRMLSEPGSDSLEMPLTDDERKSLENTLLSYSQGSLRVIAMAYRDFDVSPTSCHVNPQLHGEIFDTKALNHLVLVSAFGIHDPLRPEVVESVAQCRSAGVFVRMVTGDNIDTAKAIALECNIYTAGGIAMDGPTFRKLSAAQMDLVVPRLQVLARSTPGDKKRLVSHLRSMNEIVAVTGDGTNDALALKAADVGFSMGISGTEVAKEASAIVVLDDNLASIVKAIAWGRAINDAAKKFIQFQFTINLTAGVLTIISALVGGIDDSIFSVVQLLWINLIMDTFAALALSTDFPTRNLLSRKPETRGISVLNLTITKMIVGQSIYQLIILFVFHYAGDRIFNVQTEEQAQQLSTMAFNIYVLMQFFNQLNCRRSDNRLNIFEGITQNYWFMFVQIMTITGQIIIVFLGGQVFQTARLTGTQWAWCIFFGILTLPLGVIFRLVPDEFLQHVSKLLSHIILKGRRNRSLPIDPGSPDASEEIWLKRLTAPIVRKIRRKPARDSERGQDPTLEAQDDRDGEVDLDQLVEAHKYGTSSPTGFEIHPDTSKDDPVLLKLPSSKNVPPSQNPVLHSYIAMA